MSLHFYHGYLSHVVMLRFFLVLLRLVEAIKFYTVFFYCEYFFFTACYLEAIKSIFSELLLSISVR